MGAAGLLLVDGRRCFVERLGRDVTPLWLYGAGHVGRALVRVLSGLPFAITWVDSRADYLDEAVALASGATLTPMAPDEPADAASVAPNAAWHLVMTHHHEQDFNICETLLRQGRFGFLGMIGSATKATRFRQRLLHKGCTPEAVARLVCPIGVEGIHSKLPAAIALAVAAQLLQRQGRAEAAAVPHTSLGVLRS